MPLLKEENPKLSENMSTMALLLREDEKLLSELAYSENDALQIDDLRLMPRGKRNRVLCSFLEKAGVREPEMDHISLAESLVFSEKPSAKADFPNGVVLCRNYNQLELLTDNKPLTPIAILCPGETDVPELGLRIRCEEVDSFQTNNPDSFTVSPKGNLVLRHRQSGDMIRLSGGTKSVKKLFIDRKISAHDRMRIPVIADDVGVLGIYGIGASLDRQDGNAICITFENIKPSDN